MDIKKKCDIYRSVPQKKPGYSPPRRETKKEETMKKLAYAVTFYFLFL
jgi:hypothetical protein